MNQNPQGSKAGSPRAFSGDVQLYRWTIDRLTQPVFLVHDDLTIALANQGARNLAGYEEESLFGWSLDVLFPLLKHRTNLTLWSDKEVATLKLVRKGGGELRVQAKIQSTQQIENKWLIEVLNWSNAIDNKYDGTTLTHAFSQEVEDGKRYLRSILDGMPAFLAVTTTDGVILDMNITSLRLLGLSRDQLVGTLLQDLMPLTHSKKTKTQMSLLLTAAARGEVAQMEMEAKISDDQLLNFHATVCPLFSEGGAGFNLLWTGIDISERVHMESMLRETSSVLRLATKAGNIGLWSWDLITQEVYFSPEWKAQVGYGETELADSFDTWTNLIHPEDKDPSLTTLSASLRDPWPILKMEFRLRHRNGHYVWIMAQGSVEFDEHRTPTRMYGTHVDITARKQVENSLRESEFRFKTLVESSPDIIMIYDLAFNLTFINRVETGVSMDSLLGQSIFSFIPDLYRVAVKEAVLACLATKTMQVYETRGPIPKEYPKWYQSRVVPNMKDGQVVGFIIIATDVTELKRSSLLLEANEERLSQAIRLNGIGIFDHDHATNEIFWSAEARNIFGWDATRPIELSEFSRHLHPEDKANVSKLIQAAHDPSGDGHFEASYRAFNLGGSIRWLRAISRTFFKGEGAERSPARTIGAIEDITDRKEAELLIIESEERYKSLLETAPVAIIVFDSETFEITDVNQNAIKFFGVNIEKNTRLLFHQAISLICDDGFAPENAILSRVQMSCEGNSQAFTWEVRAPQGEILICEVRMVAFLLRGRSLIRASMADITQRKRLDQRLRESELKFRSLYELSPVGFALNDFRTGAYLDFNNALLKPTGYSREEFLKLTYWDVTPKEYEKQELDQLKSLHDTNYYGPYEKEYIRKDGTHYPVLLSGVRTVDDQGHELIWSVIQDITDRKKMEEEVLSANEQLLQIQEFINVTFDGIQVANEAGQIVYVNKVAAERLGIQQETAMQFHIQDIDNSFANDEEWLEHVADLKKRGHIQIETTNHNLLTGAVFPVEITLRYVAIKGKGYIIAVSRDISERVGARDALVKSEQTLRRAQKVAKIGTWSLDSQSTLAWSEEVYRIFGLNSGQGISTDVFFSLIHPEDRNLVDWAWHNSLEGAPYDVVHRAMVDGKTKWIREQAELSFDEKGRFIHAFGTAQDITMQRVLQEVHIAFDQAQQFAGLGTWRWTIDTDVFSWSKSIYSLLGYTEELDTITYEDFIRPIFHEDRATIERALRESVDHKTPFEIEYRIDHGPLGLRWVALKANVGTEINGLAKEMFGVLRDINSEKINKEELILAHRKAEEASRIKDEFLSVMSHEIKTPLNSVIGLSNLLLKKNPRHEQLPLLQTLKRSSDHLWNLINDVLDFNKIQTGNVELENLNFSLADLLRQVQSSHEPMALEHGLDIWVTIDPNIPDRIKGDVVRLYQILNNLVNNAIKFTSKGYVRVNTYLSNENPYTCSIRFDVVDTGIGLTQQQISKLFVPFQQAEKDITRKFGGTGLGLSIVKGLVKLLDGDLQVASDPGKGSTFSVTLTFEKGDPESKLLTDPFVTKSKTKELQNYDILYVEDVESNQLVVKEVLTELGASCTLALNGMVALSLCVQRKFDVILMDLHMPHMDGYEASRKILEQAGGKNRSTPIIAFTADSFSDQLRKKTVSAGMIAIVTKPFTDQQLVDQVRAVCPEPNKKPSSEAVPLSLRYYERLFVGKPEKFAEVKKIIYKDISQFRKSFLAADKKRSLKSMRGEIHTISPILKNLECHQLIDLLRLYRQHKKYNKTIASLRPEFVALMKNIIHHLNQIK